MKKIFLFILLAIAFNTFSQTGVSVRSLQTLPSLTNFTITTTTSAYSVGDNVGGVITLTNCVRNSSTTSQITDLALWDLSNQKSAFTIHFWKATPPNGTYTNDVSQVIAGDQAYYLGMVNIISSDWITVGAIATLNVTNINIGIKPTTGTSIYATYVIGNTATYAASAIIGKITVINN